MCCHVVYIRVDLIHVFLLNINFMVKLVFILKQKFLKLFFLLCMIFTCKIPTRGIRANFKKLWLYGCS